MAVRLDLASVSYKTMRIMDIIWAIGSNSQLTAISASSAGSVCRLTVGTSAVYHSTKPAIQF